MPFYHKTAERLQVALGVRGNGINPARRNKYLTQEALKARGAGEHWPGVGGPFTSQQPACLSNQQKK
jgi:hypothetical protein